MPQTPSSSSATSKARSPAPTLVGHQQFARRMGRNEAFNHSGNVLAALLAGLIGDYISFDGIFYLVAGMAVATMISTLLIRGRDIDYALARGALPDDEVQAPVADIGAVFSDRRIAIFVLAVTLFHFANAAMLPLVGQKLTHGKTSGVSFDMSKCIIAAQLVMIPVSILSSRYAQSWGRKPVMLIGFAVLPIRGLLYTLGTNPSYLVAVQLLDGIGAGIEGVVGTLIIADLTRGTGRFNLVLG
ncbi:MFS transporter, partial [Singulisphaera rosea]